MALQKKRKMNIKNKKRAGFYWVDNKPFVAVTEVIKILDKPALRYWFGKEVFLAMAKDPTLNEKEALSAPYLKSGKASKRGLTVHSIVEAFKTTGEKIESIPDEFKGYAKAFYKWINDNQVKILSNEKTVISKKYGYGGTLDLLVVMNGSKEKIVIDVKTGKGIYPEAFLQLSAYKNAVEENGEKVEGIAVLLLKETGNYIFERGEDVFDIFLNCKEIWEWQNKELLEKFNGDKR